jgi:hypothetical protein
MAWIQPNCSGTIPKPRHKHCSVALPNDVLFIWGGIGGGSEVYMFETFTQTWFQARVTGNAPSPRWGHSAVLVGEFFSLSITFVISPQDLKIKIYFVVVSEQSLFIIGGHDGQQALSDVYELDLTSMLWIRSKISGQVILNCNFHWSFLLSFQS